MSHAKSTTSNKPAQLETVEVAFMDVPSGHSSLCALPNLPVVEVMQRVDSALIGAFQLLKRLAVEDDLHGKTATGCELEALCFLIESASGLHSSCVRAVERQEGAK